MVIESTHGDGGGARDAGDAAPTPPSDRGFRWFLETMSEGAVMVDASARVAYANSRFLSLVGAPEARVLASSFAGFVAPSDRARLRELLTQPGAEVVRGELSLERDDGSKVPVMLCVSSAEGDATRCVLATDLTELKAAQRATYTAGERLALALEASSTGTFDWDLRTGEVTRSASYLKLLGYEGGEVDVSPGAWQNRVHPDDAARVLARREAHLSGRVPEYEVEYRMLARDGSWRWVRSRAKVTERDPNGKPLRLIGTLSDVAVQRHERELLLQDARLRGLETRVNEIELVVAVDGSVVQANDKALAAYGYTRDEIRRLNIRDLRAPATVSDVPTFLARALSNDGTHFESEHRRRDGSLFPVSVSSRGFSVAEDRYLHSLIRDLTDERRREAERAAGEERLRAALTERETLLKEVHHRVKNNLQMMISLVALQADRISDPLSVNALVDSQRRLRSMSLVHEQLYQSADLARVDFTTYLVALTGHLQTIYGASAGVAVEARATDVALGVDTAIPCALIVSELVSNALKYAFPAGRSGRVVAAMVRDAGAGSAAAYVLSVSDDGVGLPPTVDPARTKTLGLELVHILARQLGGRVTVTRDHGTRFDVAFPAAREGGS